MRTLSGADTDALLNSIGILNFDISADSLPDRTLKSILTLIPNEMTAFDQFDADGAYSGSLWYSPAGTVSHESVEVFGQVVHEHPYFAEAIRTPHERTFRVSDVVSLTPFTEHLFTTNSINTLAAIHRQPARFAAQTHRLSRAAFLGSNVISPTASMRCSSF